MPVLLWRQDADPDSKRGFFAVKTGVNVEPFIFSNHREKQRKAEYCLKHRDTKIRVTK
jgi:hypothetical protein